MPLTLNTKDFTFSGRSLSITKDKNKLLEPYHKQIWNYGIKLMLLPTNEEKEKINRQIGNARFVRNTYLNDRINYYNETKKTLTVSLYKKEYLPKLKKENEWLLESDKFALESTIEHVDNAYNNFFENIKKGKKSKSLGFPRFVSKYKPNGNKYTTKSTNNNIDFIEKEKLSYVKLPKLGLIRIVIPKSKIFNELKPNGTRILSACISKEGNNYYVSLQMEVVIDKVSPLKYFDSSKIYACDMGIKHFIIFGNEDFTKFIDNPRWIKIHQKRVRRLQKSLSRKQYNNTTHTSSKNYYKAKEKLAKEHRKIRNQRHDFHHKLSRQIVNECNVFICEDLNIKGMVKNKHLSKEISSCGWGTFLNFVKYKLEHKGGIFIKVDRFFSSSKLCHKCGYKNKDLTLKDRVWTCPICKETHDRDENAKFNLLKEGKRLLETTI